MKSAHWIIFLLILLGLSFFWIYSLYKRPIKSLKEETIQLKADIESVKKAGKIFKDMEADALLVTNMVNVRYLTGFTGSEGLAIIGKTSKRLMVDSRYTTQAGVQARGYKVVQITRKPSELRKEIDSLRIKRLADSIIARNTSVVRQKQGLKATRLFVGDDTSLELP